MGAINNHIVEANVKLQDENNVLKDDKRILNLRIEDKDKVINDLLSRIAKLEYEVEEKNKTISKALHKLRASKDHFKTERENNVVTFVIRILEGSDK